MNYRYSGQTLLLANTAMNYKKREISIYFRVSLGLNTFWGRALRLGGRAPRRELDLSVL